MNKESIAIGIAGVCFGLLVGYIWGTNQASPRGAVASTAAPAQPASAPPAQASAPFVDPQQVQNLTAIANREPQNVQVRVQLANMLFDGERYAEAIPWYEQAFKLNPTDPNVSTDLGVAYYYTNDVERALAQFDQSLKIDPKHVKTYLNAGIVRAFGKQDLRGARQAWEKVIELAPGSPEATRAREALSGLTSAHPGLAEPGGATAPAPAPAPPAARKPGA